MDLHVCIHGHFYQPPRENPWLEAVEQQDSAYPYHDWNERITAECYGPNTASRILNPDGRIVGIMNNYSRISFNFGPTLLAWLEREQPAVHAAILEADRMSQALHGGHGSALAQVYNHMILPLASSRDKRTQVVWGIRDFVHRFGRQPEGMWLSETAVDTESLELLAEHGIRFTILAPRQAQAVRSLAGGEWRDVGGERIDPTRPYLCRLPSGRSIALFFYDGPVSRALAFENLLENGEVLARRILDAGRAGQGPRLAHIATDGETYGHHRSQGEMALTYGLHHIESKGLARITIYPEYLEAHPPSDEVRIVEDSSWSCVHGIERWRRDCGCNSGMHDGWHQRWRQPLREALDWLRDELDPLFEQRAGELLQDPWAARDDYIEVVLDRSRASVAGFLDHRARAPMAPHEQVRALSLLEMQRNAMLMYTSCGWFFDELSGLETVQVLKYASRALQLATSAGGPDLEARFVEHLRQAPSNLPEHGDGAVIYERLVRPARVGAQRVAAHYAISSLFSDGEMPEHLYAYSVQASGAQSLHAGKYRLALGTLRVQSDLVWEWRDLIYAVLHLGDQNVSGGVRVLRDDEDAQAVLDDLRQAYERGDVPATLRRLDRHFGGETYTLWHLFRDQQRAILDRIFEGAENQIEAFYRSVSQEHYHLLQTLIDLGRPPPPIFKATLEFVLGRDLRACVETSPLDAQRFDQLIAEVERWQVTVDSSALGLLGSRQIDALTARLADEPLDDALLDEIVTLMRAYQRLEAPLNLWRSQNTLYEIGIQQFFLRSKMAERGDDLASRWVARFKEVANLFEVRFQ
ncbi:MAG: DUF3536 domain-containing protein [Pseudomonadota bacterium]